MDGCGHWPQYEDAATFNRIHIEFLLAASSGSRTDATPIGRRAHRRRRAGRPHPRQHPRAVRRRHARRRLARRAHRLPARRRHRRRVAARVPGDRSGRSRPAAHRAQSDHAVRQRRGDGSLAEIAPREQPFGWPRRNGFIQPLVDAELLIAACDRFDVVEVLWCGRWRPSPTRRRRCGGVTVTRAMTAPSTIVDARVHRRLRRRPQRHAAADRT